MTPIIFADYARKGIRFTTDEAALEEARRLPAKLSALAGEVPASNAVFAGRVGYGVVPSSRSIRLPLAKLFVG
jgi:hypothetical protein